MAFISLCEFNYLLVMGAVFVWCVYVVSVYVYIYIYIAFKVCGVYACVNKYMCVISAVYIVCVHGVL